MGFVLSGWRKLAAASTLSLLAPVAFALPVFTQAPMDGSDGPPSNPGLGFENADNFVLTDDANIVGLRWWGSFFDDGVSTENTDLFALRIYGDDGSGTLPDQNAVLFDATFDDTDITRSDTTLTDVLDLPIYQFDITLDPGLALSGGTPYYLSVLYLFDDIDGEFYWAMSDGGGNFFRDNPDDDGVGFLVEDIFIGNLAFEVLGRHGGGAGAGRLDVAASARIFGETKKASRLIPACCAPEAP